MLAKQITALRQDLNISMSELARLLRVDVALVVDWESGTRFPTKNHHQALLTLRRTCDERSGASSSSSRSV